MVWNRMFKIHKNTMRIVMSKSQISLVKMKKVIRKKNNKKDRKN